jgi:hypothetical protein
VKELLLQLRIHYGSGAVQLLRGPGAAGMAVARDVAERADVKHVAAAEQPLHLDKEWSTRLFNVLLPSDTTAARSLRNGKDAPCVGLQVAQLDKVAMLVRPTNRALSIMHDEKSLPAGYEVINGETWGETNYGGLRTDGLPDFAERRAAVKAATATVGAAAAAVTALASAADAAVPVGTVHGARAAIAAVLTWMEQADKDLKRVIESCRYKMKAKLDRAATNLVAKQLDEQSRAAEQKRAPVAVDVTATITMHAAAAPVARAGPCQTGTTSVSC